MPVHQAKFLQPLKSGQRFTIKGKVPCKPKSFKIDLVENDDDGKPKNIILHVNPRFDEKKCAIIRNTNIMGHWGPEETDGGFPLEAGKNFEAVIVVHDECFKIFVDGKQFCEYKHRAPVEMVTHLIVDGDVSLQQDRPQDGEEDGGIAVDTVIKTFMHLLNMPSKGYNLPVPYNKPLLGGFHEGSLVYIRCRTPDRYNRFTINFLEDSHDNKALHFDVRFDHLGDRELVVRNAKTMGNFARDESERSIPKFPFAPGKDFDIIFLCTDDRFKIAVNGEHFVDFMYRQKDLRAIQQLNINGDLILRLVLIC